MVSDNTNLKKIVTWIVLLFVPLSTYSVILESVTLGDILLFFSLLFIIMDSIRTHKKVLFIAPLFIYILMVVFFSLIHWVTGIESVSTSVLGILRYLMYLFFCLIASKNYINFEYTYTCYKYISLFFAIYVFLQFFAYYVFHFILPINVLSFLGLKTYSSVYWYDSISRYAGGSILYRPCSVFVEPAHYAVYQAPILYLLINNDIDSNKSNFKYTIVILLSIFLSGSTTGIIIIAFCLARRILNLFKRNFIKTIVFSIFIVLFGVLFFNSTYGNRIFERTFSDADTGAINGRFSNVESVFVFSIHHLYIGNGLR